MSAQPLLVLHVEDNPVEARAVQALLTEEGEPRFEVVHATSLDDALAHLDRYTFDVVLTGLNVPDGSARDTVLRLRKRSPGVPIIVLTGTDDASYGPEAIKQGAQDYLTKEDLRRVDLIRAIRHTMERHRIDQEYRNLQERYRQILQTAQQAFISIDASGRIIEWNSKAESTFGWSREDALGKSLTETIIPPEFREAHKKGFRHFLSTGEGPVLNVRIELSALHHDGHQFPVEIIIWPVKEGNTYTFHSFLHDITDRKRTEGELQERLRRREKIDNLPVDREKYTVALKQEVNGLLKRLGQPPKYMPPPSSTS